MSLWNHSILYHDRNVQLFIVKVNPIVRKNAEGSKMEDNGAEVKDIWRSTYL